MIEINSEEVEGYESNDSEYAAELWDYLRGYYTVKDLLDILSESFAGGIEALERHSLSGLSNSMSEVRPPMKDSSAFTHHFEYQLSEMPVRLKLHAYHSELEMWDNRTALEGQFTYLALLELGEDMFEVDLSDEIIEVLEHMEECETKLDQLEALGEISGEEWFERHEALDEEKEVPTA